MKLKASSKKLRVKFFENGMEYDILVQFIFVHDNLILFTTNSLAEIKKKSQYLETKCDAKLYLKESSLTFIYLYKILCQL
jgi:hypothetical protein